MSDHTHNAAEVISAFVSHNSVPASELPDLIRAVVAAFDNLGKAPVAQEVPVEKPVPAVSVRKSVHHDYLVSLEDGKRYQTPKRHLTARGMSCDEYRAKWGLAADYPMVAAGYASKRSEMSKALGLGRKKTAEPVEAAPSAKKTPSKRTAPVEADASATAAGNVQEPAEAQQEAA